MICLNVPAPHSHTTKRKKGKLLITILKLQSLKIKLPSCVMWILHKRTIVLYKYSLLKIYCAFLVYESIFHLQFQQLCHLCIYITNVYIISFFQKVKIIKASLKFLSNTITWKIASSVHKILSNTLGYLHIIHFNMISKNSIQKSYEVHPQKSSDF